MYIYSGQEVDVEPSQWSSGKVNSSIEEVLSERGVGYFEPLDDLRTKFNVRRMLCIAMH